LLDAGALCVTVNVCPPIVTVPLREAAVLLPTVNVTDPFPLPVAPDVTVIHEALLLAVHAQPLEVVTLTVTEPPEAETV